MTKLSEMSPEEALAHYGVKGMKWGVRKDRTPAEQAAFNRKVKVGAGVVALAGAAAAVTILAGRPVPMSSISQGASAVKGAAANPAVRSATTEAGKKAAQAIAVANFRKIADELSKDILDAQREQDRYVISRGMNPRLNEFRPKGLDL